jgi:hypothetical protein
MKSAGAGMRPLWAPALGLSLLVALQWAVFVPRANETTRNGQGAHTIDFHSYFLPRYLYGNEELLAGRLPVWNRLEFAGLPFLATIQPAALYPPKIACYALFAPEHATAAFLIAHQLLLAVGALVFLRSQGIGAFGAFVGAAFLAFNSTLLAANHHPNQLGSVAWIPWIFWLTDRVARTRRLAPIAALASAVALQLLAGYPEFPLQTAMLLGIAACVGLALGAWPPPAWRTLARLAAALALGALLAGIQLVPLAELVAQSARATIAREFVERSSAATGTLEAAELARLTLFWFLPGLVAFAFGAWLRRAAIAPLALHAFCAAMLLGLWVLVRELPGLSGIRHAWMWVLTSQFSLAWLVAIGADAFVEAPLRSRRQRAGAALVAAVAVLGSVICGAALVTPPPVGTSDAASWLAELRGFADRLHGGASVNALRLLGGLCLAAAACVPRTGSRRAIAAGAAGLLLVAQVAAFPMGDTAGPLRRNDPRETRVTRADAPDVGAPGRWLVLHDLRWGSTFYERRENLFGFEQTLPLARQRDLLTYFGDPVRWLLFARAEGFLDAFDVEIAAVPERVAPAFTRNGAWLDLRNRRSDRQSVLRNQDRPGRAWVTYGASLAATPQAALERLVAPDFDPRREAILEQAPAGAYAAPAAAPPATLVRVSAPAPTRLDVELELPRPGILVVSETWYPGWQATVDGAPAEILRANYLLRGVELAAGAHQVRFEYRPASLRIGAALSLVGVAVAASLAWIDRRARAAGAPLSDCAERPLGESSRGSG